MREKAGKAKGFNMRNQSHNENPLNSALTVCKKLTIMHY